MANTYTQIYIHLVFATKERCPQLQNQRQQHIYAYIVAKAKENDCFVKAIGGTSDHIHVLVALNPKHSISDFAKVIKGSSSHYINEKKLTPKQFEWQSGYGAFSVAQSNLDTVVNYIRNQVEHHKKVTFGVEYLSLLKKYMIQYDDKFVFDPVL